MIPPIAGASSKASSPAEAHVMRAPVRSVYQGVGLAGQFVMQSPVNQPSDNLRHGLSTLNDEVGNAARFTTLGKGAVHGT